MAGRTGPGQNTPVALHRELAEEIRAYHLSDAQQVDATFFADAPLMEAELHRDVAEAIAEPQSMDADVHLSEDVRETIRVLGRIFGVVAESTEVPAFRLFQGMSEGTSSTEAEG